MDYLDSAVVWPAFVATLFGGVVLAVSGVFLLALQYHRFGRLSFGRTIATAGLVVYAAAVGAYTMLPLPVSKAASCAAGSGGLSLDPLGPVHDLRAAFAPGLSAGLHASEFWQLALNVVLFIPLGILGVRLLGWHPAATVLFGFATSLAIETTQYTGIFGLFCSYRVADVGDLETNTLGALIGVLLALTPLFNWIRTPRELDAAATWRPVTRARRLLGMVFDLSFASAAAILAAGFESLSTDPGLRRLAGEGEPLLRAAGEWIWLLPIAITVLPVLGARRSTLGERCVWIDVTRNSGSRAPLWQALLRVALGSGGYITLQALTSRPGAPEWLDSAGAIWALITVLFLLFDRTAKGLSFRSAALAPWPRANRKEQAPR